MGRSDGVIQTAVAQFEAGNAEGAKSALRTFLQRFPGEAQALKTLAMIHGALHEDEQALAAISRAAALDPRNAELQFMRGNVLMILKKYKEGVDAYRTVIRVAPHEPAPYDALARCLLSLGEFDGAIAQYERSIEVAPDDEDVYKRYSTTLSLIGRIEEAMNATRRGLARLPRSAPLQEQLCYNANFADGIDPLWHREQHAILGRRTAENATRPQRVIVRDRDPSRPLRVAFMTGDFAQHACAFFLEGLLRGLRGTDVRPYLYSMRDEEDAWTGRFHDLGEWRRIPGIDSEGLFGLAQHDAIDILVDASGWTDRNNMALLVPRVAPVQATWLGYPNTTGLPAMDYRIVDELTDPPGSEGHCTERLWRLPGCFTTYRPPEGAPDPAGLPAPHRRDPAGAIIFGSFNRVTKVAPSTLRAWARVLERVPGSKLLVKAQIAFGSVHERFVAEMGRLGVGPERILVCKYIDKLGDHLPMYRDMDIALDSFPYNGTTTTCEAVWMGVPVVTMTGATHRARVGASLMSAFGAPELVARDEDDYVRIAAELAGDRARLAEYHGILRAKMAASVVCDHAGFARRFADAMRGMWREHLGAGAPT